MNLMSSMDLSKCVLTYFGNACKMIAYGQSSRKGAYMNLDVRAIKILMAQRGIDTQRELAAAVGISENALSDLFKGKRTPNLDTVGAICTALGCTPNDILAISPNAVAPVAQIVLVS